MVIEKKELHRLRLVLLMLLKYRHIMKTVITDKAAKNI